MYFRCASVVTVDGKPEWHINLNHVKGYVQHDIMFEGHRADVPFRVEDDVLKISLNQSVRHQDYSIHFSFSTVEDLGEQQ